MTAVQAVFDTYELLEDIISRLPPLNIIWVMRVSRTWNSIIQQSASIHRAYCLTPLPYNQHPCTLEERKHSTRSSFDIYYTRSHFRFLRNRDEISTLKQYPFYESRNWMIGNDYLLYHNSLGLSLTMAEGGKRYIAEHVLRIDTVLSTHPLQRPQPAEDDMDKLVTCPPRTELLLQFQDCKTTLHREKGLRVRDVLHGAHGLYEAESQCSNLRSDPIWGGHTAFAKFLTYRDEYLKQFDPRPWHDDSSDDYESDDDDSEGADSEEEGVGANCREEMQDYDDDVDDLDLWRWTGNGGNTQV